MEYPADFVKHFMQRTLAIAKDYSGPHDATLLINCMLGLLVVPKEALIEKIPPAPFGDLAKWGIRPTSILSVGRCEYGHEHEPTLRQLVRRMRNAVAHFKIDPIQKDGKVTGFSFKDKNGFNAKISLEELKEFVTRLAEHLENEA